MTLLFMDGFDDGLTEEKWDSFFNFGLGTGTRLTVNGRNGGGLLLDGGNISGGSESAVKNLGAGAHNTIIVGFAVYLNNLGGGEVYSLPRFVASDGTDQVNIGIVPGGSFVVRRGAHNGTVLGSGGSISATEFHYLEVKVFVHDTTGSVEIRVDGVTQLSLTNVDTKASSTDDAIGVLEFRVTDDDNTIIDDLYICNGAGSVNNDFLGDCVVETLLPTGNGAHSDFVGSDADSTDNYLLVDEATPDLADYVESSTAAEQESYAFADLSAGVTAVHGVQMAAYVSKPVAGTAALKALTRQGGVDYASAALATPSAAGIARHLWELNPADSAAWEKADVDGAEFGVEIA